MSDSRTGWVNVPLGYLTSAVLPALCVLAVFAPRPSSWTLANLLLRLGFVNELPFLVAYWLIASTILAAAQGNLNTPVGLVALAISVLTLIGLAVLVQRAGRAGAALTRAIGARAQATDPVPVFAILLWPFLRRRSRVRRQANIRYGPERLNTLDVYTRPDDRDRKPVFIHLHGGGFSSGRKNQESLPLIYHLARAGWVCVSANYRLSPAANRPDQLADVQSILAWAHEHAPRFGGDPHTLVLAGGSAGGYLAARSTVDNADSSVRAVILLYAYFGDLDTETIGPGTPPFLVIHGDHDPLVPATAARSFVERLRAASRPVVYAELPGAGHTFDMFNSVRSRAVVAGVDTFLRTTLARSSVEG